MHLLVTKRYQVSYLNASAGMLSWTVARQKIWFMPTDSIRASIRHSSGTVFSTSLAGQWLRGCCNQCRPFYHSLQPLSLDAGIFLVTRSAGFWPSGDNIQHAWYYSLVNIYHKLFCWRHQIHGAQLCQLKIGFIVTTLDLWFGQRSSVPVFRSPKSSRCLSLVADLIRDLEYQFLLLQLSNNRNGVNKP